MAKAVIFDFDGVIVDTEHLYIKSQNLALEKFGLLTLSSKEINDEFGSLGFFPRALERRNVGSAKSKEIQDYRLSSLQALLDGLEPNPGLRELIASLNEAGIQSAVASSSKKHWIMKYLDKFKLAKHFGVIVAREDVTNHKPHPEPYALAASKLRVKPSECAAIEDSTHGMTSAKAAGCKIIALKNPVYLQDYSLAQLVVESLKELDAKKILSL